MKEFNIKLNEHEVTRIIDLLHFHMPIGGGSLEHSLMGRLSAETGIDIRCDLSDISRDVAKQHIEVYEGHDDPPVEAAIRDITDEYRKAAAQMGDYWLTGKP